MAYSGKLDEEQISLLCEHLEEYLYEDAAAICRYVETTFGIVYSVSGMTQLLHRIGFVYKQTKSVPSKASEQDQLDFLDDVLPDLLEQANQGDAVVYYADGVHPTHNTKAGRGWIRKGRDFEVDCNSGRKRVNINGAINALKPEHLVYDITDSINAQSTQRLCRQLLRKHPQKTVYLICDNARYNRNKLLRQWAEKQRIEFVFLPPYSPNLNLIERLWKFMRKKATSSIYTAHEVVWASPNDFTRVYTRSEDGLDSQTTSASVYYDTYSKFKEGIIDFLENIKTYKLELRRLLTLNFRSVGGTSVHAQTI
ncbi:MAG: IS630 family transposase [Bacteroidota bacterium]